MKNNFSKILLALLFIATITGCSNSSNSVNSQPATVVTHDTIYPQFPGGNEALDKHLKVVGEEEIILEIDEKGGTALCIYGQLKEDDKKIIADAIATLPKWTPGTLDGKTTRFCYVYSPDSRSPINECINIGIASDRHKLLRSWYLINTDSEGVKQHPLYKGVKNEYITFNMHYQLLHKTDNEESRELNVKVSDSANEFTIEYNDSVSIAYRYSFNETNDTLTTLYTDANGKEQTLTWAAQPYKEIPIPPHTKQITEILVIEED